MNINLDIPKRYGPKRDCVNRITEIAAEGRFKTVSEPFVHQHFPGRRVVFSYQLFEQSSTEHQHRKYTYRVLDCDRAAKLLHRAKVFLEMPSEMDPPRPYSRLREIEIGRVWVIETELMVILVAKEDFAVKPHRRAIIC